MYSLRLVVDWRTKDLGTDYISDWDYHLKLDHELVTDADYKTIECIKIRTENGKEEILEAIKKIHLPGKVMKDSIIIYGYQMDGGIIEYIEY